MVLNDVRRLGATLPCALITAATGRGAYLLLSRPRSRTTSWTSRWESAES